LGGTSAGGSTGSAGAPDPGSPSSSQNYKLSGNVSKGPGITYTEQGQLFNAQSAPIDGLQIMCKFTFYSLSGGGAALWSESQMLKPTKGTFSAALGSVTPIGTNVLTTSPLFLGIQLNGDAEMTPRQQVVGQ
jgi:hypothetical protein